MSMAISRVHVAILAFGNRTETLVQVLNALELSGIERIVVMANQVGQTTQDELNRRIALFPERYEICSSATNLGSAGGYAEAVRACMSDHRCEAAWLLDDDNLPSAEAFSEILAAYRLLPSDPPWTLACYRRDLPEMALAHSGIWQRPPRPGSCVGFHILNPFNSFRRTPDIQNVAEGVIPILWSVYGGLVVPRIVIEECGTPKETMFLYGDDLEWTSRITGKGFPMALLTKAVVTDLEPSWNASEASASNLTLRIRDLPSVRVYYEVRNRNWLALTRFPGNGVVYTLNRILFSAATLALAIRHRRFRRFLLIMKALRDSERGKLGNAYSAP